MNPIRDTPKNVVPSSIPLLPSLGRLLMESCPPIPEVLIRRAVLSEDTWTVDMDLVVSVYLPPSHDQDTVFVVENRAGGEPVREYTQVAYPDVPAQIKRAVMKPIDRETTEHEHWFVSRVFNAEINEWLEENGVGPISRTLHDLIEEHPPEMAEDYTPSTVARGELPLNEAYSV